MKPAPSAGKRVIEATTAAKRGKTFPCVRDGNFPVNNGNILASEMQARKHVTAAAGPN